MGIRVQFGRRTLPIGLPTIERAEAAVQRAEAAAETAAADAIAAAQPAIVQATQDAVAGAEAQIAADRQAAQEAATAATGAAQTAAADAAALAAPAAAAAIRDEVKADADRAEVAATGVAADRAKITRLDTAVSEVAAPAVQRLADAVGRVFGQIDLMGGLHLPGLRGKSVQEHLRTVQDKADAAQQAVAGADADRAAVSRLNAAVSEVATPALRRSTDAQYRVYDLIDMVGGLHLTGLGGRSVQERVNATDDRVRELARSVAGVASIGPPRPIRAWDAVADIGLDPTGVESISGKLQAAINTLTLSTEGPSSIYFPRGVYRITTAIKPKHNVSLYGYCRDRTIFRPVGVEGAFEFKEGATSTYLENCVFANFAVDGQNQTLSVNGFYDVAAKAFYIQRFRNCLFTDLNIYDTGATGMGIDYSDGSIIQRVIVRRGGRLAQVGDLGGSGIGIGTGEKAAEPLIISDCITESCRNYGVFMEDQGGPMSTHTIISSLVTRFNQDGIGDCGVDGLLIANAQVTENIDAGITMHRGTNNASLAGSRTLISTSIVSKNGGAGIEMDATWKAQSATHGYMSRGNRIEGNGGAGHRIVGPASTYARREISIDGDVVSGNQGAGIHVEAGRLDYFTVRGNDLIENGGGAIRLEGEVRGGRIATNNIWDKRTTPTQTASIAGAAVLTDVDIAENHGIGCGPINLTGTQTRVTLGRNPGM